MPGFRRRDSAGRGDTRGGRRGRGQPDDAVEGTRHRERRRHYVVEATCIPVPGPGVARLADDGGGARSLGGRAHFASRFVRTTFSSLGSLHKEPHSPRRVSPRFSPLGPQSLSAEYRTTPGLVSW